MVYAYDTTSRVFELLSDENNRGLSKHKIFKDIDFDTLRDHLTEASKVLIDMSWKELTSGERAYMSAELEL